MFDRHALEQMVEGASGEQAAIFIEMVESLPNELKEILWWRLEGMTESEIAEHLQCTRRTVTRRLGLIRDHINRISAR